MLMSSLIVNYYRAPSQCHKKYEYYDKTIATVKIDELRLQLSVPQTSTSYGDRSFAACGPSTWNSLPAALRSTDVSVETFRTQLKTFLFNC